MAFFARAGLALPLSVIGSGGWDSDLTVAITGVRSRACSLMIGLYDTTAGVDKAIEQ
jgi:hypothetical protein